MSKPWMRVLLTTLILASLMRSTISDGIRANAKTRSDETKSIDMQFRPSLPNMPPGFRILSKTDSTLILEIKAPIYHIVTKQAGNTLCQELDADGYSVVSTPGKPGIVSAGILMGIPEGITPTYTIQSIDTIVLAQGIHLCPVPTPKIAPTPSGKSEPQGESMNEDKETYSQNSFLPAYPVELQYSGMIRSQHVARLSFSPFQYNPAQGLLQAVKSIRIEIRLGNNANTTPAIGQMDEGFFEPLLQELLVNYEQARDWRALRDPLGASSEIEYAFLTEEQPQYKIEVDQDGIYRVTYSDLQAAGVPVDTLDPRTIRLVSRYTEIPIFFSGEQDGIFNEADFFVFYGQSTKTKYTNLNIYWLTWGGQEGQRMAIEDGSVHGADIAGAFTDTLHLEENSLYLSDSPSGPDNEHWYWSIISAYSGPAFQDFIFALPSLDPSISTANVRGLIKGYYGVPQHHTLIYLNGNLIDDHAWPSKSEYEFTIPISNLIEITNTLTISLPHDGDIEYDYQLVNWFEIDYSHTFTAENNLLDFGMNGQWQIQVGGFISDTIDVFDITSPLAPQRMLGGIITKDGFFYRINFEQDLIGEHHYIVLSPSRWLTPQAIYQDQPSNLKDPSNVADIIIISHADFLNAIQPLADYRANQSMRVRVVDVQDIYDEFNGGVFSPQAIHDFLEFTYSGWSAPAPSYVLLVGDGHFDFKNYMGNSGPNYLPPLLGEFDPFIGEAASDNRYVTVSGEDILPDMFIGRLPANTPDEITAMVSKIIFYEQDPDHGNWEKLLTFVADNADQGGNFPVSSDKIADNYLPEGYTAEKIYQGLPPYDDDGSLAREAIIDAINQGRLIVHYTGHGSTNFWAEENLFSVASLDNLTNTGTYPLFLPMTCMEGYFIWPGFPSVAESVLRAGEKGAIASWSPSGFGLTSGHDLLAEGVYTALFDLGLIRLGNATTYAKYYLDASGAGYMDLIDTYNLFGDPATRFKVPLPYSIKMPLITR